MVLGVAIDASGVSDVVGVVLTPVVFAASSQFAAMSVLDSGGSALAAVLTALVVSARFSMYSAALAHRFREQPAWFRWLGPWLVVDQTFAVAAAREETDRASFRAYWLTAGALLGVVFTASTTVGVIVGPIVPEAIGLRFTIPALFVAMLAGRVRERPALVAALVGGLVTTLTLELPHGLGVLAGGLAGGGLRPTLAEITGLLAAGVVALRSDSLPWSLVAAMATFTAVGLLTSL